MEPDNEIMGAREAKITFGMRIYPSLKDDVNNEASALGQTSSEYGESIFYNRHKYKDEIEMLKKIITEKDKSITELNFYMVVLKGKHVEELEEANKEVRIQKENIAELTKRGEILNDERLVFMLDSIKGVEEIVKNPNGENFKITYNNTEDVLRALIYSCKINK